MRKRILVAILGIALLIGAGQLGSGLVGASSAIAAGAPLAIDQCSSVFNDGGRGINCDVTVVNYLNLDTNVQRSLTTTVACDGAANTVPLPHCVTTIIPSTQLVTTVSQCDAAANGGGASLICAVHVTNQLVDSLNTATTAAATVNQCAGSGIPGIAPTTNCNPTTTVTGATITECNGSGNGGTSSLIVVCTVDPTSTVSSALPVLIDQCNGSSNGGGATMVCTADMTVQLLTVADDNAVQPAGSTSSSGTSNFVAPQQRNSAPPGGAGSSGAQPALLGATTLAETGGRFGPFLVAAAILLLLGGCLGMLAWLRKVLDSQP